MSSVLHFNYYFSSFSISNLLPLILLCPGNNVGKKIAKDEALKMLLDLIYTIKMPRAGTENEQTTGFFCAIHCAFEVLFGPLA